MKAHQRILSLLLCAMLLMASCGKGETPDMETTPADNAGTETETEAVETETEISDDLPEKDLGG